MAFTALCKSNAHSLFQEISLWISLLVFWTDSNGVEFSPMLCGDQNGKEIKKKHKKTPRDICICKAESLCSTTETNIVKQLYTMKKNLQKI